MPSLVLSAVAAIVLYFALTTYRGLSRNIALAKSSGLPVVITPVHIFSVLWLSTHYIFTPVLNLCLPSFLRGVWLDLLDPEWPYRIGHSPYAKLGSDVFIVASPSGLIAFVANAEAVTQMTQRRNDFPKPLEMYGALDIYGKNLVSTEGADWRVHRKLAAPSFGEKNNELVFTETLHHAQSLLGLWAGPDGHGNLTVVDPAAGAMNFALYVISSAGFDVRVVWPHEEEKRILEGKSQAKVLGGSSVPPGHTMNYREALGELLHNIMWTQVIPPKYLPWSPVKVHRTVGVAVKEWGKYMDQMYEAKKAQVMSGENKTGMDLFNAMIRASGVLDEKNSSLQKSDLLGNAFVIMLAGHETTANTLHYSLIYLAMNWASQKRLQDDIDEVVQGRPIAQLDYEEDFPKLFSGMAAAVMNETLRLLQPILNIPKSTAPGRSQQFTMDGQQYTMPGSTHIFLNAAIHRNPRYWPAPANVSEAEAAQDVSRFRPERWLAQTKTADTFEDIKYDDEELRGPSGEDTSAKLFRPVKGSYIPFSDGARSCIGRRFAQVEILAVLAAIFSQYSVELAVDDYASDDVVEKMPKGGAERKELYMKAVNKADEAINTKMASIITLQLRGTSIPIRLVRRGEERFTFE
ncbi:cytochrome P450 monooxygenase-like protein [Dothidotthia symphoricarpi CBS 119687]|uniref:Cytochrome P450 monooxygenase-like protein n=1 Tax=Dothidotthia symphoricarpi CBS 119687 TaxID=1392245 RepID=A0A6A6AT80_9PLEO|nr:cytochrome P450 monooxygenase-like protein [Dothidotthia symphoricarpi CBS 119687]KAF2134388.1 cytochrome P450 monooxygenase-like protein [Dothidotthia symphoricarpi CBS 119687]